jgi:hypothetical protein
VSEKIPEFVIGLVFISFFLFAIIAPIYRYRRVSTPLERQQTKWLVFGVGVTSGAFLLPSIAGLIFPGLLGNTWFVILINWIIGLLQLTLPISIGLAILRYKLWDIDLIIRKTLIYSVVTGLLALVYFGSVLLLQEVFSRLGVGQSPAALVLSTLAIAALFNPLRQRVQAVVDRRFYRKKYDAEQVLDSFSARTRDEVDLDRLSAALVRSVDETVQPEKAGLWIARK